MCIRDRGAGGGHAPDIIRAAAAGIKIVFMDQRADGLEAGKDYVSVVSADNYGNGYASGTVLGDVYKRQAEMVKTAVRNPELSKRQIQQSIWNFRKKSGRFLTKIQK